MGVSEILPPYGRLDDNKRDGVLDGDKYFKELCGTPCYSVVSKIIPLIY